MNFTDKIVVLTLFTGVMLYKAPVYKQLIMLFSIKFIFGLKF